MSRIASAACLIASVLCGQFLFADDAKPGSAEPITVGEDDWPWWRGPHRNGIAEGSAKLPLEWNDTENVLWSSTIPGRGHGSPIIVGDQVILATADGDRRTQSLLCYDRLSGKETWRVDLHQGDVENKGNGKSSMASSTPACDGKRVFINFLHDGAIYTSAVSRDGKKLWQKKITDYVLHQGFGSSPAVHGSLVIVSADNKGGTGMVAALDRATGDVVWKRDRPKTPNYTSPIILKAAGREQLLMTGCDLVTSLNPTTGEMLWEIKGATTECVTSTVTDGLHIYTSGGYPKNHLAAVVADGSGKIAWENTSRVYVPSMLVKDGFLYSILDAGVAICWKSDTGEEQWKQRLGGTFSASPVLAGDYLFATDEAGKTTVFKATPKEFELVAENKLGTECFATPTIAGGRIYFRTATTVDGKRQETLTCLGTK